MKNINLFLIAAIFTFMSLYLNAFTVELDPSTPLVDYISLGEFNTDGNFEHWDFAEWDNRYVSGGSLNGHNDSGNPHMARITSQDIVFEPGAKIETRMKFNAGTVNDCIEFAPRIDGSGSLTPCLCLAGGPVPTQTDGNFHVYRMTLDTNDDPKYFGQLTSIRFNPADFGIGDDFSIDYIRVANSVVTNNPPSPTPPYTDNENNRGLLHCDELVTNLWPDAAADCFLTPDDNSSGRQAVSPILNSTNTWELVRDDSTMPTFKTNSPYGGDYLAFDGNSDFIIAADAWPGGDNMTLDLNFRFKGLPPLSGDNYACLLWTLPVKTYLRNTDDVNGEILMLVYDASGAPHFFYSIKDIYSNVWYRLSFSASNNVLNLVIGNDTEGYKVSTASATGLLAPSITENVIIGSDFFVPTRLFQGDMDEIRWGIVVPEPTMFFMTLISLGLIKACSKRDRITLNPESQLK